ncbi:glycoside hydrolase family 38 N-terminal domain-containing protein [Loigolactobacillus iwatensis]|uniref:glycoside hydrolase family 38 N-terminal domain-containing protein n=1 Tax=Loigolactobacillus iwatensis TaxID=1267156 RepID=UPI000F7FA3EF|nr:alpha-mannosidase [Loigolactobacillus iwatensis]
MTEGYIVNLTHWDREWYFSNQDAVVLSDELFSDVLDELEKRPEANFCLDGQSSILDEYLQIHPENSRRVKKLVQNKQLFIGPWFTQSDCLLVDGESLMRNVMIGIRDCEAYGGAMSVGYIPDSFGFNAQLPTILNQVGIDNIIFWRGIDYQEQVSSPYFKWQGLGDTSVTAMTIPLGYGCAPNMQTTSEYISNRLDKYMNFINDIRPQDNVLVPAGGDQQNIVTNIQDKLNVINQKSKYHYHISSFSDFLNKLKQSKELPSYRGEFRLPAYARLHRTISSVRINIKQANHNAEQKLIKQVEPLMVLGREYGINISQELLVDAWKKVLASQAHDSLGGCVYDAVSDDIMHRYKEADELSDGIQNLILRRLADKLALSENQVLLVNTEAEAKDRYYKVNILTNRKNIKFKGITDAFIVNEHYYPAREHILIEKPEGKSYLTEPAYFELSVMLKTTVPGLGYKVIDFNDDQLELPTFKTVELNSTPKIETTDVKIEFLNGNISATFNGKTMPNLIKLVDCANDGDTYDFSPLKGDTEVELPFNTANAQVSGKIQQLIINGTTNLPYDLIDRQNTSGQTKAINYKLVLSLNDDTNTISGEFYVDNTVCSHRMRLVLNPEIKNADVFAGLTAGALKNNQIDMHDTDGYDEYPAPLNVFDKVVSLSNHASSFSFYGGASKEYELAADKLYITLFASTGQFGKPNLMWRPGRASGDTTNQGHVMIATPEAQLLGPQEFDFSLKLFSQTFNPLKVQSVADEVYAANVSYQNQSLNYFINRLDNKIQKKQEKPLTKKKSGMLELDGLTVSSIYPSYKNNNRYLIRVTNPTSNAKKINTDLFSNHNPEIVNALEVHQEQKFVVEPYDMVTIKLDY